MPTDAKSIDDLATTLQHGELTSGESDRMLDVIRSEPGALRRLVEQLLLSAALQEHFSVALGRPALRSSPIRQVRRVRLAAFCAACLVGVMALVAYLMPSARRVGPAYASVAHEANAKWSRDSALRVGVEVGQGVHTLEEGIARIDLKNGVTVSLQGPSEFEITRLDTVALRRGTISAYVPPNAIGFRVRTPFFDAIDLGTAFGIRSSDEGGAELCVFEGGVRVDIGGVPAQHLHAGSAVARRTADGPLIPLRYPNPSYEDLTPLPSGILELNGPLRFVLPGPELSPQEFVSEDHLTVFLENRSIEFNQELVRQIAQSYPRLAPVWDRYAFQPGAVIRSYLVQLSPMEDRTPSQPKLHLRGAIRFDGRVIGVLGGEKLLRRTDKPFGHFNGEYGSAGRQAELRRVGSEEGKKRDAAWIEGDRGTLHVDFYTRGDVDQIRVLVLSR